MEKSHHSNHWSTHWFALKKTIILLIFSVIGSFVCVFGTYEYKQQMAKRESAQETALKNLESKYSNMIEIENIYKTMEYRTFKQLIKKGFFEEGQKSDDLDMLKLEFKLKKQVENLVKKMHIPSGEVEQLQSDVFEIPNVSVAPEFKVYKTQLTLKLGVLHEGDVLKLLENLKFNPPIGLMNSHRCHLSRLVENVDVKQTILPNFEAKCTVFWYKARVEKENEK